MKFLLELDAEEVAIIRELRRRYVDQHETHLRLWGEAKERHVDRINNEPGYRPIRDNNPSAAEWDAWCNRVHEIYSRPSNRIHEVRESAVLQAFRGGLSGKFERGLMPTLFRALDLEPAQ